MLNDIAYLHKVYVKFIGCKPFKLHFCFEKPNYKGNSFTQKIKIKLSHNIYKGFFKRTVTPL